MRSSTIFRGRNADLDAVEFVGLELVLVFRLDIDGCCDVGAGPRRIEGLFDCPGWKIDENEVRVDTDDG